ncbi:hypothetical protein STEG23_008864, partial [Scotinomys teguina]
MSSFLLPNILPHHRSESKKPVTQQLKTLKVFILFAPGEHMNRVLGKSFCLVKKATVLYSPNATVEDKILLSFLFLLSCFPIILDSPFGA